jgi:hypothetical protein
VSNSFSGGGDELDLTNGGTEVFVDVLMLAVSSVARAEWHVRFAGLLAWQDQFVRGRGMVGFDLAEIHWGTSPAEQEENRAFVLEVIELALRRHRWEELSYDPPFAEAYLRRFRGMVAGFAPSAGGPRAERPTMPDDDIVVASCVRHRVLAPLPEYRECVFCTRG